MLVVHADEQVTTEPMFNPSLTVFEKVEGGGGQGRSSAVDANARERNR